MHGRHVVALMGVPHIRDTGLAGELTKLLCARGLDVGVVASPAEASQLGAAALSSPQALADMARLHAQRIAQAVRHHAFVIADDAPLTWAVLAHRACGDTSLYDEARAVHATFDMTLLRSFDPGSIRLAPEHSSIALIESIQVIEGLFRSALLQSAWPHAIVSGSAELALAQALATVEHVLETPARQARASHAAPWRWLCENCDDGECERHWLVRSAASDMACEDRAG